MDRVSLQEGNMHTIEIMSTDEKLSLLDKFYTLESYVQNKDQQLNESMRALEQNTTWDRRFRLYKKQW